MSLSLNTSPTERWSVRARGCVLAASQQNLAQANFTLLPKHKACAEMHLAKGCTETGRACPQQPSLRSLRPDKPEHKPLQRAHCTQGELGLDSRVAMSIYTADWAVNLHSNELRWFPSSHKFYETYFLAKQLQLSSVCRLFCITSLLVLWWEVVFPISVTVTEIAKQTHLRKPERKDVTTRACEMGSVSLFSAALRPD